MNLVIYFPCTWPTISTRVFRSFLDLVRHPVEGCNINPMISDTFPLDRNRNEAVDNALSSKYAADYIFFADADQIWPVDTIPRLLAHVTDEFPVVSGLYFRKAHPHVAVPGHYATWEKHESQRKTIESMGFIDKDGNQTLFYKPLRDFTTIQTVDVSGMGCLLVRSDIFKKLEMPYFAYFNCYSLGGDYTINHASEEMLFFSKLRKAGIKTLLDPSVRCGHEVLKVIGSPEME